MDYADLIFIFWQGSGQGRDADSGTAFSSNKMLVQALIASGWRRSQSIEEWFTTT
jgi:hypothetical protein